MATATGPDTARLYALGRNPDESARLRRQSDELSCSPQQMPSAMRCIRPNG